MAVCPDGHQSASDDFCDVCGLRITSMSQAQATGDPWGSPSRAPGAAAAGPARPGAAGLAGDTVTDPSCPHCHTARTGRFCEGCGLDYTTGRLPDGSLVDATGSGMAHGQPAAPYSPTLYSPPGTPVPVAPASSVPAAASPVPPAFMQSTRSGSALCFCK